MRKIDKSNGWSLGRTTIKYDDYGNEIEQIHFNRYEKICSKKTCKYSLTGKHITIIEYLDDYDNAGDIHYISESKFDKNNNIIEEFTEHPHNNINSGYKIVSSGSEYKYYYNFDEQGNWVKKTENQDSKPINIKEREIDYH